MFNNATIVHDLATKLDESPKHWQSRPRPRRRVSSDPCLPSRLPNSAFLQREGEENGPKEILRQLRRSPSPVRSDEESTEPATPTSPVRRGSTSSLTTPKPDKKKTKDASWKDPQPFEVFRAIERKDLTFLMQVRDNAFHLLLRKSGDATPLVYAMRIGNSHRDVTIVLLGAMSRWVNHLDDTDMSERKTKTLLKALRANLKLAIDYGLQSSYTDLIASFMQTLIMSEGDKWVLGQTNVIALGLRSGTDGKPVHSAEEAVRKFVTKELGKAEFIASLEDYIANATADLLLMGAWSCVLESVSASPIPTYYFARDDRVFKAFQERVRASKDTIARTCTRRLKWQLRVLERVMEGRSITYRAKIELLAGELDEGPGV